MICPPGVRWIVVDVTAATISTSGQANVYVPGAGTIAVLMLPGSTGGYYAHWTGRQVVNPGEHLTISSTPGGISVLVTGYELSI